jgi:3-deoxy-manno-octulosonate cytidylyltransferase (CMP-KDO synthetase)
VEIRSMYQSPSFIVAIPARYASVRLPGKPLQTIAGEPMLVHVARRAQAAGAKEIIVATDDQRIVDALSGVPVTVVMTRTDHRSGSDRLAECADLLSWPDDAIVVNLQGDEPLAPPGGIRAVAATLAASDTPMATLATPITSAEELFSPNCVKVLASADGDALYFTRAPAPWARDAFAESRTTLPASVPFLRHIGIYAYRAGFLREFARLAPTPLELAESLEQLRALEHGKRIALRLAPEPFPAGVDTMEDLERVRAVISGSHG